MFLWLFASLHITSVCHYHSKDLPITINPGENNKSILISKPHLWMQNKHIAELYECIICLMRSCATKVKGSILNFMSEAAPHFKVIHIGSITFKQLTDVIELLFVVYWAGQTWLYLRSVVPLNCPEIWNRWASEWVLFKGFQLQAIINFCRCLLSYILSYSLPDSYFRLRRSFTANTWGFSEQQMLPKSFLHKYARKQLTSWWLNRS